MKNKFLKTMVLLSLVFSSIYAKDIIIEKNMNINMNQKELEKIYKKYVDRTYPTKVKTYKKEQKEKIEAKEREARQSWHEIKNSTNHKKFQSFINEYPNSKHLPEAQKLFKQYSPILHQGYEYKTVKSPYTKRLWLDRNLGASKVCTSYNDSSCYGSYYKLDGRDVCPNGFGIPTRNELEVETTKQGVKNEKDAFQNFLKFPLAGNHNIDGSMRGQGDYGFVWSSSHKGENTWFLYFDSGKSRWYAGNRAYGQSVRCLKDYKYEK